MGATKRLVAVAGVAALAMAWTPTNALAAGARLYEMTENMKITTSGGLQIRTATSQLLGTADVGTPLCPLTLVNRYAPGARTCTVNATGTDTISVVTGKGTFSGSFTTVVQGDNGSDAPETVVMTGTFSGQMDFSPAMLRQIPLGTVTGKLNPQGSRAVTFRGTFRLPFQISGVRDDGSICTPRSVDPTCVAVNDAAFFGGQPLPLAPMARYDLGVATRPLYLLDNGDAVPVGSSEFAAGWAAVKFEINF